VPPVEKDLKKASRITLPDVVQGDRAFVTRHFSADQKSISPVAVIIYDQAELAKNTNATGGMAKAWFLAGTVTAPQSGAKEVTISALCTT